MKLAVATAVYPGVEAFFPECLDSLKRQTDRDFTIVIADAGMTGLHYCLKDYVGAR